MSNLNETFLVECDLSKEAGTRKLMAHHLQSDAADIKENPVKWKVLSFWFFIVTSHEHIMA